MSCSSSTARHNNNCSSSSGSSSSCSSCNSSSGGPAFMPALLLEFAAAAGPHMKRSSISSRRDHQDHQHQQQQQQQQQQLQHEQQQQTAAANSSSSKMGETQLLTALHSLFSPTDPTAQRQAGHNLVVTHSLQGFGVLGFERVVCFAAQTLRTKCLFDIYQLPPDAFSTLVVRIAAAIKQHQHNKAVLTQLSLALAAVSLSQQQESPLLLLLQTCGLDSLRPPRDAAEAQLLLLLLTRFPIVFRRVGRPHAQHLAAYTPQLHAAKAPKRERHAINK
ncbi:hypothetical protein ACSSS7_006660 [Eimeria intestinalis]